MSRPNHAAGIADGAGVLGAVFAALCCAGTPIIVSALAALGLSFLRSDRILWPLMLVSLVVAVWGFWKGRQMHGSPGPLLVGLLGAGALTAGVIFVHGFPAKRADRPGCREPHRRDRMEPRGPVDARDAKGDAMTVLVSVLTCPVCGARAEEKMPENACQFFYQCNACRAIIRPRQGDCCVFCSYGSVPCPPVQASRSCCE